METRIAAGLPCVPFQALLNCRCFSGRCDNPMRDRKRRGRVFPPAQVQAIIPRADRVCHCSRHVVLFRLSTACCDPCDHLCFQARAEARVYALTY
jgi:hypothetical protein